MARSGRSPSWVALSVWAAAVVVGRAAASERSSPEPQRFEAFKFVLGFFGLDSTRELQGRTTKMSVFGAGFSRTGTKSLEAALLRLGHKVYDTRSMLELGQTALWEQAATEYKESGNVTMIDTLLADMESRGYTATLDFPLNLFAPIFAQRRPDSKVLMSVRPSEDSWVEAWEKVNDILSIFVCRPWSWMLDMGFNKRILRTLYDWDWPYPSYPEHIRRPLPWFEIVEKLPGFATPEMREVWKTIHRRLHDDLKAQLPKERFTTFQASSGWGPLLDFLGVDDSALASEPFPRVNDRNSLQVVRWTMDIIAAGLPLWILLGVWALSRCARCCFARRSGSADKAKRA